MLAYCLDGVVSLHAFRAFTPGRDESFGIEHVDCVIRDRVDQKLVAMSVGGMVDTAGGQGHISASKSNFEHVKRHLTRYPGYQSTGGRDAKRHGSLLQQNAGYHD